MFLFTLSGVHMEDPPFLLGVGISAGVTWGGGDMKRKKKKEETVKEKGVKTEDKGNIEVKSLKK